MFICEELRLNKTLYGLSPSYYSPAGFLWSLFLFQLRKVLSLAVILFLWFFVGPYSLEVSRPPNILREENFTDLSNPVNIVKLDHCKRNRLYGKSILDKGIPDIVV